MGSDGDGQEPVPGKDDLSRGMDEWQLECYFRLRSEHGHSPAAAWNLAQHWRWDIEVGLRKPGPLIIVSGI